MFHSISILGATGSIGTQALDVIRHSGNKLRLRSFSFNKNVELAAIIISEFRPDYVLTNDYKAYADLKFILSSTWNEAGSRHSLRFNEDPFNAVLLPPDTPLEELVKDEVDIVLSSVTGTHAVSAALETLLQNKILALANKETMVAAGSLVNETLKHGGRIIPVDSEHSAIYQCLMADDNFSSLVLTASGGAFRDLSKSEIAAMSAKEALKHPNWSMGNKITIDSATLMNKGLELIEAMHLFNISEDKIEVLIHRQSIIHSMVRYLDGSIIAQMGLPDMRQPIAYALYDHRRMFKGRQLDFSEAGKLSFEKPDLDRFPCLKLARIVAKEGGIMPAVLNAANEVLVESYLNGRIHFYDISSLLEKLIMNTKNEKLDSVPHLQAVIADSKLKINKMMEEI